MLVLVSGCGKVNALRNALTVGRQDNQSVQDKKQQPDNSQVVNPAKPVELDETVEQISHSTDYKVYTAVVLAFVVCVAGYMLYRYFYPANDGLHAKKLPEWHMFASAVPDTFNSTYTSLFKVSEADYWRQLQDKEYFSEPKRKCYEFLIYFYIYSVPEERRSYSLFAFKDLTPIYRFSVAFEAFNIEMASRMSARNELPLLLRTNIPKRKSVSDIKTYGNNVPNIPKTKSQPDLLII